MILEVTDNFQNYIKANMNIQKYSLLADLVLFLLVVYTYYVGDAEIYTRVIKFVILFLAIRYIASLITNYGSKHEGASIDKQSNENKQAIYFQLNSYIAIFTIIMLAGPINILQLNNYTTWSLIIGYALFVSAIQYGYTIDNLLTILVVYQMYINLI